MFYILPFSHSWLECLPVAILAAFIAGGCLPLKTSISQSQTFSLPESIALPEDCVHAELSPDNKWLACSRTSRGETQAGLWLIEIATRQMTAVALNQESQMSASGEVLEEGITHTYPLWSPDSRYLAFFSFKGLEPGSEYNLWIVGISDLADRKSLYESETPIIAAAWSPNGSKIALADTTGNLTLVDPSGHSEELADRDVAVYPLGANALAWSSDGSKLAYPASSSGGGLTLWSMDLLTGDRVSLLRTMQQDRIFIPAWSPDGKTTAVLSGRYSAEGLSENPQLVWIDSNGAIVEEVPQVPILAKRPRPPVLEVVEVYVAPQVGVCDVRRYHQQV